MFPTVVISSEAKNINIKIEGKPLDSERSLKSLIESLKDVQAKCNEALTALVEEDKAECVSKSGSGNNKQEDNDKKEEGDEVDDDDEEEEDALFQSKRKSSDSLNNSEAKRPC